MSIKHINQNISTIYDKHVKTCSSLPFFWRNVRLRAEPLSFSLELYTIRLIDCCYIINNICSSYIPLTTKTCTI